jgi:LytS/YehU family sensor histidine kinase
MFKPVSKYYWWCQLSGWLFWMSLNVVLAIYYDRPMHGAYFANLVVMGVSGILITHLFRRIVLRYDWLQYPLDKLIFRMLLSVVICASLITILRGSINIIFHLSEKEEKLFSIGIFVVSSFLVTAWTAIYFLWHYFQKDQQYTLDRLRMQTLVNDLELRTIKSQLNPHFLFNALNSIRALIDENPKRARAAVTELSNILRSSMQAEKVETVSLENELNIVRDYLALEHIRFEERLKVHYDIDPNTEELPVPPMMLQTLVENAIKHGISKSVEGGILNISSQIKGTQHVITIRNTGQLNGHTDNGGFGLQSTRQRLGLLYKNKARFEIGNLNDHIVEVKVSIDL